MDVYRHGREGSCSRFPLWVHPCFDCLSGCVWKSMVVKIPVHDSFLVYRGWVHSCVHTVWVVAFGKALSVGLASTGSWFFGSILAWLSGWLFSQYCLDFFPGPFPFQVPDFPAPFSQWSILACGALTGFLSGREGGYLGFLCSFGTFSCLVNKCLSIIIEARQCKINRKLFLSESKGRGVIKQNEWNTDNQNQTDQTLTIRMNH
jgi:hypothetical protein